MKYKYKIKSIEELKRFIDSTEYVWEDAYDDCGINYSACMNVDMLASDYVITKTKINNFDKVNGECFTIKGKSKGIWQWESWMVKDYKNIIMDTE